MRSVSSRLKSLTAKFAVVVLLLIGGVAGLSWNVMSAFDRASTGLTQTKLLSARLLGVTQVGLQIADIGQKARAWLVDPQPATFSAMQAELSDATQSITTVQAARRDPVRNAIATKVLSDLGNFGTEIETMRIAVSGRLEGTKNLAKLANQMSGAMDSALSVEGLQPDDLLLLLQANDQTLRSRMNVSRFNSNGDPAAIPAAATAVANSHERIQRLLGHDVPAALLDQLKQADAALSQFDDAFLKQRQATATSNQSLVDISNTAQRLLTNSAELRQLQGASIQESLDKTIDDFANSRVVILMSSVAMALLCVLIWGLVNFTVVRPLRHLTGKLGQLAEGDDEIVIAVTSRQDEIGEMTNSAAALRETVARAYRLGRMVNDMPQAVMLADPKTGVISYANKASHDLIKTVQEHITIRADQIVGANVDAFHRSPEHNRAVMSDPKLLPSRSKVVLGPETMNLQMSAVLNRRGDYVGSMLAWEVITRQVRLADTFEASVGRVVASLGSTTGEIEGSAGLLAASAEANLRQSELVAKAADMASSNVSMVASAAEELSASVNEIGRQMEDSARFAASAAAQAIATDTTVESLSAAAEKVAGVVRLISDIAAQTNLLALNATIEAARAGEQGKGFAVVASEVKELATQTARATADISQQIEAMKSATGDAVGAIRGIRTTIERISEIAVGISSAVEEQSAATAEIARNVQEAARGTTEVTVSIAEVNRAAAETGEAAASMQTASSNLASQSSDLRREMDTFLKEVRAA